MAMQISEGDDDDLYYDAASEDDFEAEDESDSDIDEDETINWDEEFRPPVHNFQGPDDQIKDDFRHHFGTSLDILRKFIDDSMVEKIAVESNRYAEQVKRTSPRAFIGWTPVTAADIWRFLSLILAMTLVKKSSYKEYWSTDPLVSTTFFPSVMSRDRFISILRALHFVNNETVPQTNQDRFIKLGSFMTDLLMNFQRAIHAGKVLCIDESLIPFKGRLSFKQYNPKKRSRFGVKLFLVVDSAMQFVLDVLPYQGKSTQITDRSWISLVGFGGAAVLTLLQPYLDAGRRIIIDNWFHSLKLARMLKDRLTYVLGTVQKRRKGIPRGARMTRKLRKGEVETFSDGDVLIERWQDRREVLILNTFMPHGMTEWPSTNPNNQRMKPDTVLLYNKTMGGVDNVDKTIKPNQSLRKSYKWYKKVAFYLVELSVYNSMIMYNTTQNDQVGFRRLNYEVFVKSIIHNILTKFPVARKPRGRPSQSRVSVPLANMHIPERVMKENGYPSKSDCFHCKTKLGKRTITQFKCLACEKRLCIGSSVFNCFKFYHDEMSPTDFITAPQLGLNGILHPRKSALKSNRNHFKFRF
ncbi:PiggyBac transposable element-derived protein 4 [Folsomia candida]|uniref:PiggyBac transposable element-derived protein 4 n=1 Tax=Folsomia candida TaxID=158441 RepID=A0A226EJ94_FOLCA|nr:PiggyBac transposable element-derived protein 4 [Folsomia candida]